MRFAKRVFLLAGMVGVLMVIPPYFLEEQLGRDNPPPVNHPELYYGFFGVTLSWQFKFLVIGMPFRFLDAGRLRNARTVERMTLLSGELGQRFSYFPRMNYRLLGEPWSVGREDRVRELIAAN